MRISALKVRVFLLLLIFCGSCFGGEEVVVTIPGFQFELFHSFKGKPKDTVRTIHLDSPSDSFDGENDISRIFRTFDQLLETRIQLTPIYDRQKTGGKSGSKSGSKSGRKKFQSTAEPYTPSVIATRSSLVVNSINQTDEAISLRYRNKTHIIVLKLHELIAGVTLYPDDLKDPPPPITHKPTKEEKLAKRLAKLSTNQPDLDSMLIDRNGRDVMLADEDLYSTVGGWASVHMMFRLDSTGKVNDRHEFQLGGMFSKPGVYIVGQEPEGKKPSWMGEWWLVQLTTSMIKKFKIDKKLYCPDKEISVAVHVTIDEDETARFHFSKIPYKKDYRDEYATAHSVDPSLFKCSAQYKQEILVITDTGSKAPQINKIHRSTQKFTTNHVLVDMPEKPNATRLFHINEMHQEALNHRGNYRVNMDYDSDIYSIWRKPDFAVTPGILSPEESEEMLREQQAEVDEQDYDTLADQPPALPPKNPVVTQQQPIDAQQQPIDAQQQPIDAQQQPIDAQQQPIDAQQQPIDAQQQQQQLPPAIKPKPSRGSSVYQSWSHEATAASQSDYYSTVANDTNTQVNANNLYESPHMPYSNLTEIQEAAPQKPDAYSYTRTPVNFQQQRQQRHTSQSASSEYYLYQETSNQPGNRSTPQQPASLPAQQVLTPQESNYHPMAPGYPEPARPLSSNPQPLHKKYSSSMNLSQGDQSTSPPKSQMLHKRYSSNMNISSPQPSSLGSTHSFPNDVISRRSTGASQASRNSGSEHAFLPEHGRFFPSEEDMELMLRGRLQQAQTALEHLALHSNNPNLFGMVGNEDLVDAATNILLRNVMPIRTAGLARELVSKKKANKQVINNDNLLKGGVADLVNAVTGRFPVPNATFNVLLGAIQEEYPVARMRSSPVIPCTYCQNPRQLSDLWENLEVLKGHPHIWKVDFENK